MQVKNKGVKSKKFKTTKGVKQGGPLSPFLFAFYIDQMLTELAEMEGICVLRGNEASSITGIVAYADDIIIMTETKEQLERVVKYLVEACNKLDLLINEDKTKIIIFGTKKQCAKPLEIKINDKSIEKVSEIKYLGVQLHQELKSTNHIEHRIKQFNKGWYTIAGTGITGHELSPHTKAFIMRTN
jgi:hypothetical protein